MPTKVKKKFRPNPNLLIKITSFFRSGSELFNIDDVKSNLSIQEGTCPYTCKKAHSAINKIEQVIITLLFFRYKFSIMFDVRNEN